jgi:hypothetical protein
MMLRSGSLDDSEYTITIERTEDHEDFETLDSYLIAKENYKESIEEFKSAIESYLKYGGSKSSLELFI